MADVAAMERELAELRAANHQAAVAATVRTAIDGLGVELHAGAASQITELLRGEIAIVPMGNGQSTAVGPGGVPAAQHVANRLNSEAYAHFKRPAADPAAPQPNRGGMLPPPPTDGTIEPVGVRICRAAEEQRARQAQRGAPAVDMSQSFGLRFPVR